MSASGDGLRTVVRQCNREDDSVIAVAGELVIDSIPVYAIAFENHAVSDEKLHLGIGAPFDRVRANRCSACSVLLAGCRDSFQANRFRCGRYRWAVKIAGSGDQGVAGVVSVEACRVRFVGELGRLRARFPGDVVLIGSYECIVDGDDDVVFALLTGLVGPSVPGRADELWGV